MGPLDILDHSSPNYAFGSKLCIDATRKLKEELSSDFPILEASMNNLDIHAIQKSFDWIENVHIAFSNKKFHILFVSVRKDNGFSIGDIENDLFRTGMLEGVKLLVCFDHELIISDIPSSVWILTNNIDSKRDCTIFRQKGLNSCILIDATKKISPSDNFERDWPNIIISDNETIEKVDSLWESLNLGPFVKSPSLYYTPLVPVKGAVLKKKSN